MKQLVLKNFCGSKLTQEVGKFVCISLVQHIFVLTYLLTQNRRHYDKSKQSGLHADKAVTVEVQELLLTPPSSGTFILEERTKQD